MRLHNRAGTLASYVIKASIYKMTVNIIYVKGKCNIIVTKLVVVLQWKEQPLVVR